MKYGVLLRIVLAAFLLSAAFIMLLITITAVFYGNGDVFVRMNTGGEMWQDLGIAVVAAVGGFIVFVDYLRLLFKEEDRVKK